MEPTRWCFDEVFGGRVLRVSSQFGPSCCFRSNASAPISSTGALASDDLRRLGRARTDPRFAREEREHRSALPLVLDPSGQSLSPALADIIGARRVRTAVMTSSGSIPCR